MTNIFEIVFWVGVLILSVGFGILVNSEGLFLIVLGFCTIIRSIIYGIRKDLFLS